ncbi:MAG: hypothetical protein ACJA0U_002954 [Salibacteraceae bacterium]|jgi:hypothetical protein
MKLKFILLFVCVLPSLGLGQQLTHIATLQDSIQETSGIIYLEGILITHNDSGGEPMLYEIDSISGNITRSVFIENATNTDWEDICFDSTYIYIADFGNNSGSRTDLKVYRLLISDYLLTPNDTVTADTINFSYLEQTDFSPSPLSTNFDAESIFSYNDSLFIFTKNWGNNWTNIYALPKTPGTYQIEKADSIDVQGLITGGTYNDSTNTILLSGYTFTDPFIVEISGFTSNDFSNGTINHYLLAPPAGASIQIESITCFEANQYYLTSELNTVGPPTLYRLDHFPLNIDALDPITASIYPNPASDCIKLEGVHFSIVEIYDALGILRKTSDSQSIGISDLTKGTYFLIAKDSTGRTLFSKKMIIL